jgi:hypothetical protein
MEQRGTTVSPLAELDDLRRLATRPGRFLTSYAAFEPASEALAQEVRMRWEARRRSLAAAEVPESALDTVARALEVERRGAAGLAVVVPSEGKPLVERLVSAPEESATWQAVPALRPLVAHRQRHVAHVVALVDRAGADLRAWTAGDPADEDVNLVVTGEDEPIRKVAPGGWSQRRFQQRAEDSWQHNMAQVAAELSHLADRVHARVVAVGGDERAIGYLLDALPAALRDRVWRIGVTRASDGSSDRLDAEVAADLDAWSAERIGAALALHAQELGQRDRATAGAGRTVEALRAARVALLFVAERGTGAAEERRVWMGPTRDQVATTPGDLAEPDAAVAGPLLDGAVTAALATGADLLVVSPDGDGAPTDALRDGLGALLRW